MFFRQRLQLLIEGEERKTFSFESDKIADFCYQLTELETSAYPNSRYHTSRLGIQILKLLFVPLQSVDFVLEALDVVDGALEDRALVGLSDVEVLDDVVEELVGLRQESSQLLDSVVYIEASSSLDCKFTTNKKEKLKPKKTK